MSDWGRIVEDRIQEAMEAGAFDDLPGKGQPLRLDDNPFQDGAAWAAHHLLRSNGYTLPWIEERNDLEAEVEAARATLARSCNWLQGRQDAWAEAEWQRAVQTFREQAARLNRRIRDHNLKVPAAVFQRPPLDAEREIKRLTQKAELGQTPR